MIGLRRVDSSSIMLTALILFVASPWAPFPASFVSALSVGQASIAQNLLRRTSVVGCFVIVQALQGIDPALASVPNGRLAACAPDTNCVSSNFKEAPNRYVSPLTTVNDRDEAFRRAVRDIERTNDYTLVEISPKDYYIHLQVPGTAPKSEDDIELVVAEEGIVNLRCQAQVTLPPPPFCIKKNCINGNMDQRERVERLAQQVLGLPPVDQSRMQEDAKWTPIFFNSDRVPAMYDDDY